MEIMICYKDHIKRNDIYHQLAGSPTENNGFASCFAMNIIDVSPGLNK